MNFKRRQQTDLMRGRVSMLASMGYITPEIIGKLLGYVNPAMGITFAGVPNDWAAISKLPSAGWAQVLDYGAYGERALGQPAGATSASRCSRPPTLRGNRGRWHLGWRLAAWP